MTKQVETGKRQFNECAKNISDGLYQASRETGLNYVERRQEGNKKRYKNYDNLPDNAEYYRDNNRKRIKIK